MTKKQKEQYLNCPNNCPFCDSEYIKGGEIDFGFNMAWREIQCRSCYKKWNEIFTITNVEDINE